MPDSARSLSSKTIAFLRMLQVVLDPDTPAERYAAFADFFAHDGQTSTTTARACAPRSPGLFPARVQLVDTQEELRGALADARGVAVEALTVGREELAAAPKLKFVQKYGLGLGDIDTAACAERGVAVLNIRRRANIACAEHAHRADAHAGAQARPHGRARHRREARRGRLSLQAVRPAAHAQFELGAHRRHPHAPRRDARADRARRDRPRDRDAAPSPSACASSISSAGNWPEAEERALGVAYAPLDTLLAEADWLIPQLPEGPVDPQPDRRRAACAHEARRLHRQRVAAGRDRSRGADRGAEIRPARRLCARPALSRRRRATTTSCCNSRTSSWCRTSQERRGSMRSPISRTSSTAWRGRWRGRAPALRCRPLTLPVRIKSRPGATSMPRSPAS